MNQDSLADLVKQKRAIVCCGAGGVGKTSVSAALALAGAAAGRRVLAVTIDPSRRLAESLGVERNTPEPVPIPTDRLREVGVYPPGTVETWMLDPAIVTSSVVRAEARTPEEERRMMHNRVFKHVKSMVAGLQEFAAVEALHIFIHDGRYDLVILDTPPSRNALQFLDAPLRAGKFLDGRIFRFFLPSEESLLRRAAGHVLGKVFDTALGMETRKELQNFFLQFSTIFARTNRNAGEMWEFFSGPQVSFLMVTSPAQEALEEAFHFEDKTKLDMGIKIQGYVLNRSLAAGARRAMPLEAFPIDDLSDEAISGMWKLQALGVEERQEAEEELKLHERLRRRVGPGGLAVALPHLGEGVSDLGALAILMKGLISPRGQSPEDPA